MDMEHISSQLLESPVVLWIRTFAGVADLTDLVDGHLLNQIMTEIDPNFFGMSFVHSNVDGDVGLRVQNFEHLLRSIKNFYQERLQEVIVMDLPNIFAIASDPETEESIQELHKILLLILGCAVQCERKEFFIEKITSLNESIQQELVLYIKEITEKCDKVFTFHPNEIAALSHEELLSCCEVMYDQIVKVVDQRDFSAQETHRLMVDRVYPIKEVNGNIRPIKSPPLSPTHSELRLAEKEKFRQITEQLDEKDLLIQDLKDELESNKLKTERLVQENKSLSETTRWMSTYRDDFDALKVKVEKTKKLENDVKKYKEKLLEMDGIKKRTQELEEQNQILYDTKQVLEKQVHSLSTKAERLVETEREVLKLKKNIKDITEEKAALEVRHQNVLEENARLLLDAQNSFSEVSSLSSELNMIKEKEESGICLANECNLISSTQLLRLEHENHRLKVLIGELTQHKNSAIPQAVVTEDSVDGGNLEKISVHNDEITENAKVEIIESLASVKKVLNKKESELTAIQEKLKKQEEYANTISETLSAKEQENKELQDRVQQVINQKRRTDQLIQMKNEDYAELERRLEEVIADRQKSDENLRKKTREINELNNRLMDAESRAEKREINEDMASRKIVEEKNDKILELESRLEDSLNSSKKLQHTLNVKDEKIVSLETRLDDYEESIRQCDRLTQKVTDRDERIKTLNERLCELESHGENNERLNQVIAQKDEKIKSLERSREEIRLKNTNIENELAKIQYKYEEKVKRSLEDVDTHKIRRQESVRRREEQIKSLEQSKSKLETILRAQEGHIQTLQDRLEGSVSERNKLGSNISKKESLINQLQTKILELEEATTETRRLNELVRIKDETIKRFEDRVREVELVLSRAKSSNREKHEKIESLQGRIEECSEMNKKLDLKLKKKEENLLKTERDLLKSGNRVHELETSLEQKSEELRTIKQKNNLSNKKAEESLTQSPNSSSEDSNKIQHLKQKLWEAETKIEEAETEKGKLQHQIKRRQTQIHELEKRLEEHTDALEENERLKKTISHKEERLKILQAGLEQNQKEINSLESRLESSMSEIYKLRRSDEEKMKRINSFKMKLENSDGVNKPLSGKEERIRSLEERNEELRRETSHQKERVLSLEAELEKVRSKKGSSETIILNTSPKQRNSDIASVKIDHQSGILELNNKVKDLEKKNDDLTVEKESLGSKCTILSVEKESINQELETLRSDYDQLISDLTELKDSYTDLDLSSAKSLHRCEMLTQMNSTLEEENRMLMEQMDKLLTQNQELLTESLVSRDQFMEEERSFSDRLYELQRQKEKLEEKIEQANKSLAEITPKKKSNLFKKVLQKAGLKKKKDETLKGRSPVQLIKYDNSPGGTEGSSDVSGESGTSFQGVYPVSAERASDSSNFSEDMTTDNSPERDLSPLARRRARVNRAHRSRVARSEYFTPTTLNALSTQGRSRSLDAKEFLREVIQAQSANPEEQPGVLVSSNSMAALRNYPTPNIVEDSRQVTRTNSFNLGRGNSESNTPVHLRKKSVETRPVGTKPPKDNTPEMVNEMTSASSRLPGPQTPTSDRKVSDGSHRSSEVSSLHSRSSSLCSADTPSNTSKTTVRHVGSTLTTFTPGSVQSTESKMTKAHYRNGSKCSDDKENSTKDDLRLSSGSGDSTDNEKSKRISRHQTPPPPPRMTASLEKRESWAGPLHPAIENGERATEKPAMKRSSSIAERPPSPSTVRSESQREKAFAGSMEVERRVVVHSKQSPSSTPKSVTPSVSRKSSSAGVQTSKVETRADQVKAQSISIVSFKEGPRVHSAVLESSPQLEKKPRSDVEHAGLPHSGGDQNIPKEPGIPSGSRRPQTPKSLRRTSKHENLSLEGSSVSSPKKERAAEDKSLWFEYGQV